MTDTINMMLWGIGQAIVSDFNVQMNAVYGIVIISINVQNVKVGITVPVDVHEKPVKITKVEVLTHAIPQVLNLGQINNKKSIASENQNLNVVISRFNHSFIPVTYVIPLPQFYEKHQCLQVILISRSRCCASSYRHFEIRGRSC